MVLDLARSMLGKGEISERDAIQEYLRNGGANLDPATTAWCAAFVNSTLKQSGIEGTGSNLARSFMDWGEAVEKPQPGDLAVFSRGDPNGWQGHVGFFEGRNPDGTVRVLGGNQSDAVNVSNYPTDRLLGYRRAPSAGQPAAPQMAQASAPQSAGSPALPLAASRNVSDKPIVAPMAGQSEAGKPTARSAPFGDAVAPRPPSNFGTVIANWQQRKQQRDEEEEAERQRRALLLGEGLGGFYG